MLKSVSSVNEAIELIHNVIGLCDSGGFNLTKFVCTVKEVLDSLPITKLAPILKEYDLSQSSPLIERALGVHWCIENDNLFFKIVFKDSPLTRTGILSTISSIYDPPGLASPFILPGRLILQAVVHEKKGWDTELSAEHRMKWEKWRSKICKLDKVHIRRCVKPTGFGKAVETTLHHFADASEAGYGTASYIRQVNENGDISVSLLMGKSRVTPMRTNTIPKLELGAAGVAAKVSTLLNSELDISPMLNEFWSDSRIVLGYITNESKRFKTYVANCTQLIRQTTDIRRWHYIPFNENPADIASRGLDIDFPKVYTWFNGPDKLRKKEETWKSDDEC